MAIYRCTYCGHELETGDHFCPYCGSPSRLYKSSPEISTKHTNDNGIYNVIKAVTQGIIAIAAVAFIGFYIFNQREEKTRDSDNKKEIAQTGVYTPSDEKDPNHTPRNWCGTRPNITDEAEPINIQQSSTTNKSLPKPPQAKPQTPPATSKEDEIKGCIIPIVANPIQTQGSTTQTISERPQRPKQARLQGRIGQYGIHLYLTNNGNGVEGWGYYDNHSDQNIRLKGYIEDDGRMILEEYEGITEANTGRFTGSINSNGTYAGTFINKPSGKVYGFYFEKINETM